SSTSRSPASIRSTRASSRPSSAALRARARRSCSPPTRCSTPSGCATACWCLRKAGSASKARSTRRARLGAEADIGFLAHVPGVTHAAPPSPGQPFWTLDLKEGDDGRALLAACFERAVPLTHFDVSPPGLHEVFVSLVGEHSEAI